MVHLTLCCCTGIQNRKDEKEYDACAHFTMITCKWLGRVSGVKIRRYFFLSCERKVEDIEWPAITLFYTRKGNLLSAGDHTSQANSQLPN